MGVRASPAPPNDFNGCDKTKVMVKTVAHRKVVTLWVRAPLTSTNFNGSVDKLAIVTSLSRRSLRVRFPSELPFQWGCRQIGYSHQVFILEFEGSIPFTPANFSGIIRIHQQWCCSLTTWLVNQMGSQTQCYQENLIWVAKANQLNVSTTALRLIEESNASYLRRVDQ